MGRGRQGDGVVLLNQSIRIRFSHEGVRHQVVLPLTPSRANTNHAKKLVSKIRQEIRWGTFKWENYASEFPDYRHAPTFELKQKAEAPTFSDYAVTWLSTLTVEEATRELYTQTLTNFWGAELGPERLDKIRRDDIAEIRADRAEELSAKTINNAMIPLRGMFDAAVANGIVESSPATGLKNLRYQKPPPDPFAMREMGKILAHMQEHYPEPVHAYFEFAFGTGLRPSELIALRWGDIDWEQNTALVQHARVRHRDKGTKTHTSRFVDLSKGAIHALELMKAHTFEKGIKSPVFCDPTTKERWPQIRQINTDWFQPALDALVIRPRGARHTRHTYATLGLMAGVNVAYISQQLGHSSVATTLTYYARWVRGGDGGVEARKLSEALNWSQIGQNSTNESAARAARRPKPAPKHQQN